MAFPRQEYWSGLSFPSPRDLPDPGIKPVSPALAGGFFTIEPPGKPAYHPTVTKSFLDLLRKYSGSSAADLWLKVICLYNSNFLKKIYHFFPILVVQAGLLLQGPNYTVQPLKLSTPCGQVCGNKAVRRDLLSSTLKVPSIRLSRQLLPHKS